MDNKKEPISIRLQKAHDKGEGFYDQYWTSLWPELEKLYESFTPWVESYTRAKEFEEGIVEAQENINRLEDVVEELDANIRHIKNYGMPAAEEALAKNSKSLKKALEDSGAKTDVDFQNTLLQIGYLYLGDKAEDMSKEKAIDFINAMTNSLKNKNA